MIKQIWHCIRVINVDQRLLVTSRNNFPKEKLLHMFIISGNNLKKDQNISLSNVIRSCLPTNKNKNT